MTTKFKRKVYWAVGLLAVNAFLVGFWLSYATPKLKAWLLIELEKQSRERSPIRILPKEISVSLIPLGVELRGVRLQPKAEIAKYIEPFEVETIEIRLSLIRAFVAQLFVSELNIDGAQISIHIPPSDNKPINLEGVFDLLEKVPVGQISIANVSVDADVPEHQMHVQGKPQLLTIVRSGKKFGLDLDSSKLRVQLTNIKKDFDLGLRLGVVVNPEEIQLRTFEATLGKSNVKMQGTWNGNVEKKTPSQQDWEAEINASIEESVEWARAINPAKAASIPKALGTLKFKSTITQSKSNSPSAKVQLSTQDLEVLELPIGAVDLEGTWTPEKFLTDQVKINGGLGSASITESSWSLHKPFDYSAKIQVAELHLQSVFAALKKEIPVWFNSSGSLDCTGQFENPVVDCRGEVNVKKFKVSTDVRNAPPVAEIAEGQINGRVKADSETILYEADLVLANSKAKTSGVISFEKGFEIQYSGTADLRDFGNTLSTLKLEGITELSGSTKGTSQSATFNMKLDAKDVWFTDFLMGNFKTNLDYKSGVMYFRQSQGSLLTSRYQGEVEVDLNRKRISMQARSPYADVQDVLMSFSRKFKMPVTMTGTGSMQITLNGPFDISAMTYDLRSTVFRGTVAGEPFEQIIFDVMANKGEVQIRRAQMTKNSGLIMLTGQGHPNGNIEAKVIGRNLRLQDFSRVTSAGFDLTGLMEFDLDLSGHVLHPTSRMRARFTKMALADEAIADSSVDMALEKTHLRGKGVFLGDVVNAQFDLPYDPKDPMYLKLSAKEWNFTPLFGLLGTDAKRDFTSALTASLEIKSDTGGFWGASGQGQVQKFHLQKGDLFLKNSRPVQVSLNNGSLNLESFVLEGNETSIRVATQKSDYPIDIQATGKLDLNILGFLTPFLEELRGTLAFALQLKAKPDATQFLGTATISKGYAKLFNFPHAVSDLSSDLLFNNKRVLLNFVKADFAGGKLSADGNIEIKKFKDIPVNIHIVGDKLNMLVPEKVKSTGDAQIHISGNWFPYLMKGQYKIASGRVEMEFGKKDDRTVRRSYFLPQLEATQTFSPITQDLDIDFTSGVEVKNSLVEGRLIGQLKIKETPEHPILLGTVTTDNETKVFFHETPFDVVSANFQFQDPKEINPKIYLSAKTRVESRDIDLLVQGFGSDPQVTLSSNPPLPEKEIISLLALGVTSTPSNALDDSQKNKQQTGTGSFQIGSAIFAANPISKELKDRFGVDLQVSGVYESNEAMSKITVSRQFSKKFGVTGARSFGGTKSKNEVKVQYRLTDKIAVSGSWEGKPYQDTQDTNTSKDNNLNTLGLDLEYRFKFR